MTFNVLLLYDMKYERIVALSSGTCVKIDNSLKAKSVGLISAELENDRKFEDHVEFFNERDVVIDGKAYTDNNRVSILNPVFDSKTKDLIININTTGLDEGDLIEGNISVISNVGFLSIPYKYTIVVNNKRKIINNIHEITDFYDVLSTNFDTAKAIFTDKEFLKTELLNDEKVLSIYEGLSRGSSVDIAIIEFFKAFNIDVRKYFVKSDSEITRSYIEDSDISIDYDELKNNEKLNNFIVGGVINNDSKVGDEIVEEATYLIECLADKEFLNVMASTFVRNNFTDEIAFRTYLRVIEKGSDINGIYDKFILSIPDGYEQKLPLYLYRLYYDDKSYSFDDKAKLYENIITAFNENDEVYRLYNQEILEYALSRIYQNRVTASLVNIYNKIFDISIINENNYNNILYLLRNHKIIINNPNIKKIVIRYKEIDKETKYEVHNGIAYVPIFFDTYLMFFEDSYGNRFYKEKAQIKVLFDRKDLERFIIENYTLQNVIDMTKIIKLNEQEKLSKEYEIEEISELESKTNINYVIKKKFTEKIIDYYFNTIMSGAVLSELGKHYIRALSLANLDLYGKRKVIKILIEIGEYKRAYEFVSLYGISLVESNDLLNLFLNLIKINDEVNSIYLLNDMFSFVKERGGDNVSRNPNLLEYLANNYEGHLDNLLFILNILKENSLNTFVLAKRLLMYSIECNYANDIDHIHSMYDVKLDTDEKLEIAYLNKKATDYFLDAKETNKDYFINLSNYLISHIDDIDSTPLIFILAITKYISEVQTVDNNMRRILIKSIDRLISSGYVFAYFKKLHKLYHMPYNIMNKEYIEYHADKDFVPKLILSIGGEDVKREVELNKVFMNIYVKKITVFKNEIINYEVINAQDPSSGILYKGTLSYDENYENESPMGGRVHTTFDYVNDAIVCLDRDNIEGLKRVFIEMTEKQELSRMLFNIR